nr:immunoglobulin light chain junction region [Macaca mulatta]
DYYCSSYTDISTWVF